MPNSEVHAWLMGLHSKSVAKKKDMPHPPIRHRRIADRYEKIFPLKIRR